MRAVIVALVATHGDRTKLGEPFVTHPIDENIVVIDGTWAFGMGSRFARMAPKR